MYGSQLNNMKYYFLTITGIKNGNKHRSNITVSKAPFFNVGEIKSELGFETLVVEFFQEITKEQWEYHRKFGL